MRFWTDPKGWVARRLLNAAFAVDRECPLMCDQKRGWRFERNWKPQTLGEKLAPFLDRAKR